MIMQKDKILKCWEEYIRELFDDDRGDKPRSYKQSGLQIMQSEVAYGLKCMSIGKAAGPDGLMVEMFEALGDFGIKRITQLANKIYNEGREQRKDDQTNCLTNHNAIYIYIIYITLLHVCN